MSQGMPVVQKHAHPLCIHAACSVGWFVLLLVREEVLLAGLCERKILFRLKIYNRLRQATAKRTGMLVLFKYKHIDIHKMWPLFLLGLSILRIRIKLSSCT